jgi:ubiquinone/menaquinone biosynthesis C-methylase UbiE
MSGGFTSDESVQRYSDIIEKGLFEQESEAVAYFDQPPSRVLDLGCGAGRTTKQLAEAGFDVVGLDVSRGMVEAGSELAAGPEYVHASATHIPFENESFDNVLFAFNGIDYLPTESDRETALLEIHRVLKDDGWFVFCSHNPRYVVGSDPYNPFGYLRMIKFWLLNVRHGRVTETYKYDVTEEGLTETHFITPEEQREQLRSAGFEPVTTISRFRSDRLSLIDLWPYYVARKR